MSEQRLIDGRKLLYKFSFSEDGQKYYLHDCDNFPEKVNLETVQKMIRNAPTVPAEVVVHCRDCRKRNTPRCNMTHNMGGGRFLTCNEDLGYCNFAEMEPIKIEKVRKADD